MGFSSFQYTMTFHISSWDVIHYSEHSVVFTLCQSCVIAAWKYSWKCELFSWIFHHSAFKCLWKALTPETWVSCWFLPFMSCVSGKWNPGDKLKANMGAVKDIVSLVTSAADSGRGSTWIHQQRGVSPHKKSFFHPYYHKVRTQTKRQEKSI